MGVSNRSRQSTYYGDRNRGWNFVRGAFALLALIGISFLFGFFVLARLMPDTRATSNGAPVTASNSNAAQPDSQPAVNHPTPQPSEPSKRNTSAAEPTLEPETDDSTIQKPTMIDGKNRTDLPPTNEAPQSSRDDLNKITQKSTPPFVPADQMRTNSEPVQSPSNLETSRTSRRERERERRREQAENTKPAETPPAASTSLFRVQVGVYSTKDAAEQEAAKVRERGFDANVHVTTEGGRTLYHIQNGVYRNRANAEAMQKRLKDAGIETHLAEIANGTDGKP